MSLPWSDELSEVVHAARVSAHQDHARLTSKYLLRAMLEVQSDAQMLLRNEGIDATLMRAVAQRTHPERSGVVERLLERATAAAGQHARSAVTPVHVYDAITRDPDSEAFELLELLGVDVEKTARVTRKLARGAGLATTGRRSRRRSTTMVTSPGVDSGPSNNPPSPRPNRRQIAFHPALAELLDGGEDEGTEEDAASTVTETVDEFDAFDLISAELPTTSTGMESYSDAFGGELRSYLPSQPRIGTARSSVDAWRGDPWTQPQTHYPHPGERAPETGASDVPSGQAFLDMKQGSLPLPEGTHQVLGPEPTPPPMQPREWRAPARPGTQQRLPWDEGGERPPRQRLQRPSTEQGVARYGQPPSTPRMRPVTPLATPPAIRGRGQDDGERRMPGLRPDLLRRTRRRKDEDDEGESPITRRRRKRRQKTARESMEETAKDLAERLFTQTDTDSGDDELDEPTPPDASEQESEQAGGARDDASEAEAHPPQTSRPKREREASKKERERRKERARKREKERRQRARERREQAIEAVCAASSRRGKRSGRSPIIRRKKAGELDRFELNPKRFPTLAKFGRNLLAEARAGRLDPVIGRDEEIEHLVDILNKRRSNNPLLVGAAGVGKTAIVEGLAREMASDLPPPGLHDRTIIALEVGTLLCGTALRGSFQERLIAIKKEVAKAGGRIILFLDELHSWLGAGSGDAGSDAAGELKVALARGQLPCVGATTDAEFKRFVEADAAFERRFEMIEVKPPSVEDSVSIIGGIIHRYAEHHGVVYDNEMVEVAVKLSDRYVRERTLPDKAIAILDRAGSVARRQDATAVGREHVAAVVSSLAHIDIERLLMEDGERFLEMENELEKNLVGHDHAINRVARTIRRNYAGFASNRPIGSFLFLGPTGVGKTEMVKVLADFLFGSRDAIVRFDMSEFMEQHAVARLLGAPPGYVGFDDGGQLTEAVRRHPYQIILLDEIEKAHPDVLNILLQLLDEGRVTDGRGRTVDFSNTVVVMTSNLGASVTDESARGIGFGAAHASDEDRERQTEDAVLDAARGAFPPELWNRIEERIVFHPLRQSEVERIARLQLKDSAARLAHERDIHMVFDDNVVPFLIENGGFEPRYGARPMRKTIQRLVESAVADSILRAHIAPGDDVCVFVEQGLVLVERVADQFYDPIDTLDELEAPVA